MQGDLLHSGLVARSTPQQMIKKQKLRGVELMQADVRRAKKQRDLGGESGDIEFA